MNQVMELLVGINYGAGQAADYWAVGVGEIIPVDAANVLLAAGSLPVDSPVFKLIQGTANDSPRQGQLINARRVKSWTGESYRAATEQVSYVGYNGTATNTIDAANDSTYVLRVKFTHEDENAQHRQNMYTFIYESDGSATALEIATYFTNAINNSLYCSKLVTAAVTNAGADYGISITGKVLPFSREIDDWNQVTFKVLLGDTLDSTDSPWGTTTLDDNAVITNDTGGGGTLSVLPDYGIGTWQHMYALEYMARAWRGQLDQTSHPINALPAYIVESATYDVYTLVYEEEESSKNLNMPRFTEHVCYIALPEGAAVLRGRIEAFMNPYMNALGFASVTL